jgi:predicted phosphodiesterase
MIDMWLEGFGTTYISEVIIKEHDLDISVSALKNIVEQTIKHKLVDKELLKSSVKLAKQKQKAQDLNRIERKSFREHARIENAVSEYSSEIVQLLKDYNLMLETNEHISVKSNGVMIVHLTDTHFNELVNIDGNQYDFKIGSKRLQKFADIAKRHAELYDVKSILLAITGDLMNSDRRLDEMLSMATNRAKATFLSVNLISHFIKDLNKIAHINIACVTGNESRVKENNGWTDITASDNYDFTIYEMLRLLYEGKKGVSFVDCGLEVVVNIGTKNVLLIHGHQMKGLNETSVAKLISKYLNKGTHIDFVICGHKHHCIIGDFYAQAGSPVGANSYSDNALNLSSRASQNIYIYTEEGRYDTRIDLQNTIGYKGYDINLKLAEYNAKSLLKTKSKKTLFEIVI